MIRLLFTFEVGFPNISVGFLSINIKAKLFGDLGGGWVDFYKEGELGVDLCYRGVIKIFKMRSILIVESGSGSVF